MDLKGLNGKVAVVTGGAGAIGGKTSSVFAEQGARVVVADVHGEAAAAHAKVIIDAGGTAIGVEVDLAEEKSILAMFDEIDRAFGAVDVLHNNASPQHLARQDHQVADVSLEIWDATLAVALRGAFLCSRVALPRLVEQGGGSIVFTSSVQALFGDTSLTAYSSAKSALLGLTRSIATQYGRQGIRCNAVCPGFIPSPRVVGENRQRLVRHQLLAREGLPDDIANVVVFLSSDEGSFITGQVLTVDGGASAHVPTYAEGGNLG